jgi:hypothetical protein
MSYRSLRSVMFTSVSVWCITVRAIFGEGIRPIGKKIYLESIATCQILFSKFGLSKPPPAFYNYLKPIHLELKSDATPYHIKRAFTIPQCYMESTKNDNISIHSLETLTLYRELITLYDKLN